MRYSPATIRRLFILLALALVGVRIGDTHLHLCFDGREASAAVHSSDGSVHHGDEVEQAGHADQDVDPFLGALVKKGHLDLDPGLLAWICVLALLLPLLRDERSRRSLRLGPTVLPFHLRPPLRGPPL
jgi:hypothetical protein